MIDLGHAGSDPNLDPGTAYTVTVTATNVIGTSAPTSFVLSPPPRIVAQILIDGLVVDAVTGYFVEQDGSEVDPLTLNQVVAPPATYPPLASYTYPTYLLTQDPVSGLYTSFFSTTVDLSSGNEFDPTGNLLDQVDLSQMYLLTTAGTVVNALDLKTQLDPVTLQPVSTAPYTVAPTLPDYQVNSGTQSAALANE